MHQFPPNGFRSIAGVLLDLPIHIRLTSGNGQDNTEIGAIKFARIRGSQRVVVALFGFVCIAYNRLIVTHGIEETMALANQLLTTLDKDPIYRSISF